MEAVFCRATPILASPRAVSQDVPPKGPDTVANPKSLSLPIPAPVSPLVAHSPVLNKTLSPAANFLLSTSTSVLPAPLKFLWFSRESPPEKPETQTTNREEVISTTSDLSSSLNSSDFGLEQRISGVVDVDRSLSTSGREFGSGKQAPPKSVKDRSVKSWVPNIINLTYLWRRQSSEFQKTSSGNIEETSDTDSTQKASATAHPSQCGGCDSSSKAGQEITRSVMGFDVSIAHDKKSFAKFLQRVQLSELKLIARMSFLSNQAYYIPQIKKGDLYKHHKLRFLTSSLERKAVAAAKEKVLTGENSLTPTGEKRSPEEDEKQSSLRNPAAATYAFAATAASYLASQTKLLLPFKSTSDFKELKAGSDNLKQDTAVDKGLSVEAASSATNLVAAEEETKDAVAADLKSQAWCPSEWFVCDEEGTSTRYFSIQGSDSLASWQANLLFEPTQFEDPEWGIMVHRGMYEAAKGLYEQLMPLILEHVEAHGEKARFYFTGHSLGGSLAILLTFMLCHRKVLPVSAMLPVYTFGSPSIMCGGNWLLEKLGFPPSHVRSVMLHYDIVPRTFSCHYPAHIAEILRRVNGTFRAHSYLDHQKILYAPIGHMIVLQPDAQQAPAHPLLPEGSAIYLIHHSEGNIDKDPNILQQVRSAERSFLNTPHPLEILSDPSAYGSEGTISRDHDSRSYLKATKTVLSQEFKIWRRTQRERRRQLWSPLVRTKSGRRQQRRGARRDQTGDAEILMESEKAKKSRSFLPHHENQSMTRNHEASSESQSGR
ncbi:unnamed protein product [Sphagnum jensenii]|uniref:Fungal lipase-type domain-containing protein n=1 Tax=Sphagnum jensenii TaxID=128206 RepID=A0ABP1A7G8_9BRYO